MTLIDLVLKIRDYAWADELRKNAIEQQEQIEKLKSINNQIQQINGKTPATLRQRLRDEAEHNMMNKKDYDHLEQEHTWYKKRYYENQEQNIWLKEELQKYSGRFYITIIISAIILCPLLGYVIADLFLS